MGNISVNSGETAETVAANLLAFMILLQALVCWHSHDIEEHAQGILSHPVESRVEVASLKRFEARLDTVDIGFAVLSVDGIELSL